MDPKNSKIRFYGPKGSIIGALGKLKFELRDKNEEKLQKQGTFIISWSLDTSVSEVSKQGQLGMALSHVDE